MGDFDCYCAFCGGTMQSAEFKDCASGANSDRASDTQETTRSDDGDMTKGSHSDGEIDSESESDEDSFGYNPKVLRPEETEWLTNCRVVGFNSNANGATKYVEPIYWRCNREIN